MSVFVSATRTAAVAALALGLAGPAGAATLVNGSFEKPGGAPIKQELLDGSTFVNGWTVHGSGTYYESDGQDGLTASDGDYWLGFGHNGAVGASITQSFLSVAGAHYTLSYDFALQQGSEAGSRFRVSASTGDSVDTGDAAFNVWASGPALSFTGTGSAITLTVLDNTAPGSGGASNLALDHLRLSSDAAGSGAPEPAGWALMIIGFTGAGAVLRRRRVARPV
jgi:hypothetical protein